MTIIDTTKLTPQEIAKVLWDEGLLDDVSALEQQTSKIKVIRDPQRRKTQWTEQITDLGGGLLSKRVDTYTYYDTGEIDLITQSCYDGQGNLISQQEIKHFKDGRPVVLRFLT